MELRLAHHVAACLTHLHVSYRGRVCFTHPRQPPLHPQFTLLIPSVRWMEGTKAQRIRNIPYRNWEQQLISPVEKPGNDKFAGTLALNNRVATGMVSHERWFENNKTPLWGIRKKRSYFLHIIMKNCFHCPASPWEVKYTNSICLLFLHWIFVWGWGLLGMLKLVF